MALIWLAIQDFWCHISCCSDHRDIKAASISSLKLCCEPKVDNFAVIVFVEQNVFRLKISMANSV